MKKLSIALSLFLLTFLCHAKTVTIGFIFDGQTGGDRPLVEEIKREIIKINTGEFNVNFPKDKELATSWKIKNVKSAINILSNDKTIDLIITHSLLASNEAAQYKHLKKPVIATLVADRKIQQFPYNKGKSLKKNFTYINNSKSVDRDLRKFHQLTPFKKLLIPINPILLESIPLLRTMLTQVQSDLGFSIVYLPISNTFDNVLQQIPSDIDAVYILPLAGFSEQELSNFAKILIDRQLPSFSLRGRADLEQGFMATLNGREIDSLRFSRRVALMVQSILLGADPANLNVDLEQPSKLAINIKTAHAIGYYPGRRALEEAEALFNKPVKQGVSISLPDAMRHAVEKNLSLSADQLDIAQSEDQVSARRSALLPQLTVGLTGAQVDQGRAGIQQSEQTADVEINLSQLVYSERKWSDFDVSKLLKQAENKVFQSRMLDILSQTATAYFRVLSAQATEKVRRGNLDVSRANLELAKMRLKIGYSNRSESLRWQSVIATDKSQVYLTQAQTEQQKTELKRLLHLNLNESISISGDIATEQINSLQSKQFNPYFDNLIDYKKLIHFEIEQASNNSPELKQMDYLVQSSRRQLDAGKRAYYIPDVNVNARFGQNIEQGGQGKNNNQLHQDEWSIGFQATLPLFTSGGRSAEVSRAGHALTQNTTRQDQIKESIDARVRSALQKTKGSYPAVRLSKDAAAAANENFKMVSESYASGQVSITSVIDAQNAALSADLSAVEALYSFMIDWVETRRAVANFDVFLSPQGLNDWGQALKSYKPILK